MSRKSRRLHLGRESSENLFNKSRRLHVGLESRAVSALVAKVLKVHLLVAPFPESRRIHLGRESRAVSTSVEKALKNFF